MIENLGSHCQISAFGARIQKKSCKEGLGQLDRKIKNLGNKKKKACCDSYQNQLSEK